jgi:hypothetical protein
MPQSWRIPEIRCVIEITLAGDGCHAAMLRLTALPRIRKLAGLP